jgi:hypothetical protein
VNEAPDFVEPFNAWRVWKVVRRHGVYMLGSVVQRTLWPAGEALEADCLRRRTLFARSRRKRRHDAPEASCECGIYGAALERVGQYVAEAPCRGVARVLGRVALWGTVIECERGFRASHAYPTRVYVPADAGDPWRVSWEEVALGLWRYGSRSSSSPPEPARRPSISHSNKRPSA